MKARHYFAVFCCVLIYTITVNLERLDLFPYYRLVHEDSPPLGALITLCVSTVLALGIEIPMSLLKQSNQTIQSTQQLLDSLRSLPPETLEALLREIREKGDRPDHHD